MLFKKPLVFLVVPARSLVAGWLAGWYFAHAIKFLLFLKKEKEKKRVFGRELKAVCEEAFILDQCPPCWPCCTGQILEGRLLVRQILTHLVKFSQKKKP